MQIIKISKKMVNYYWKGKTNTNILTYMYWPLTVSKALWRKGEVHIFTNLYWLKLCKNWSHELIPFNSVFHPETNAYQKTVKLKKILSVRMIYFLGLGISKPRYSALSKYIHLGKFLAWHISFELSHICTSGWFHY